MQKESTGPVKKTHRLLSLPVCPPGLLASDQSILEIGIPSSNAAMSVYRCESAVKIHATSQFAMVALVIVRPSLRVRVATVPICKSNVKGVRVE